MNFKQKYINKRRMLNLVRISNRKINTVRISTANTYEHEKMKFELCWVLANKGYDFITEAIFTNGSRADILCLD